MSESKKQTPANVIEMLVNSINKGDTGAFYSWVERYQESLSPGGDVRGRITRLLNAKPPHMALLDSLNQSGSKLKNLVGHRIGVEENVFVGRAAREFLDPLLTEWANRQLYSFHNIGVRTKLLLHGPTGNGKTTLARYLATRADLPLIEVQSDNVINSHLGKTSKHINDVFAGIKEPCVMFWDEVDSVGRRRGSGMKDDSAGLENERMVNSILVNMEKLSPDVIFVGATNRREALDTAFLRRFDTQFEVGAPDLTEKQAFARQLLAFHQLPPEFEPSGYEDLPSFSAVKLFVIEAARAYIAKQVAQGKKAIIQR